MPSGRHPPRRRSATATTTTAQNAAPARRDDGSVLAFGYAGPGVRRRAAHPSAGLRDLVAMGTSAGIIPGPEALSVLLLAIGLNRWGCAMAATGISSLAG